MLNMPSACLSVYICMYTNKSALKLSMIRKSKTWYTQAGINVSVTHSFSSLYALSAFIWKRNKQAGAHARLQKWSATFFLGKTDSPFLTLQWSVSNGTVPISHRELAYY